MFTIEKEVLEELVSKGLKDSEIGKMYNVIPQVIYYQRKKIHKIERPNLRYTIPIFPSSEQQEVLFGCLLGDGYMRKSSYDRGPYFSCAHSLKQSEYAIYKSTLLESLGSKTKINHRNIPNKKTGKFYSDITISIQVNAYLCWMYEAFYGKGKKRIPVELLDKFYTPLAMAIHFMDDGSKAKISGYSIATCGFERQELEMFSEFLFSKYGICNTVGKGNRIYIKSKSKELFKSIIEPYIEKSMLRKLQQ